jgi:hypothetical protein
MRTTLALMLAAATIVSGGCAATPPGQAGMPATASPTATCGDLLASLGKTPPYVTFAGCAARPEGQGKPLRATYKVDGAHAAAVEAFLAREFGLAPLQRSCCVWDAAWTGREIDGRTVMVTMGTVETPIAARADWAKISEFVIIVDMFTIAI